MLCSLYEIYLLLSLEAFVTLIQGSALVAMRSCGNLNGVHCADPYTSVVLPWSENPQENSPILRKGAWRGSWDRGSPCTCVQLCMQPSHSCELAISRTSHSGRSSSGCGDSPHLSSFGLSLSLPRGPCETDWCLAAKIVSPLSRGNFWLATASPTFQNWPRGEGNARQVRDKNCLVAIFAPRHQSVSSGPLGWVPWRWSPSFQH